MFNQVGPYDGGMATLAELARMHTRLDGPALGHLQRLMGSWGMLADLCFADLLLFVPVTGGEGSRFIVLGQMRPTTSQTLHREDLVGRIIDEVERPLVARAWRLGEIVEGEITVSARGERARVQCIPVRFGGELVAVMTREAALAVGRRPGELERVYVEVFDRFARMIVGGEFPFASDEADTEDAPRVGDGALLLDETGRVGYASPNAVNALHRMGVYSNAEGLLLGDLGIDESVVRAAFATSTPATEEVERRPDVIVLVSCIPLLDGGRVSGALVLMRDVTDLRRRDRLLLSKDAAIREVHHRVKNNLQTISSLLRLQARRLAPGEGRVALAEAERRIRSIALVHEILSREAGEQVDFNDIVPQVVRMAEDGLLSDRHVAFTVAGDAGELPAEVATPLAVVLTELLQNAAEHAFPETLDERELVVAVELENTGSELIVGVRDNGAGLPPGFSVEDTKSLGLSIVRDLVRSQLGGSIAMHTDGGTIIELRIPVRSRDVVAAEA
ncbi:MAG: two-component system, sensor histidine kinase PdtaS [Acidimicrobiaceae bacterium]|nr:two-component system, sensor histidine kinase PdtaS [Acidimicrobiaceae bacterium]